MCVGGGVDGKICLKPELNMMLVEELSVFIEELCISAGPHFTLISLSSGVQSRALYNPFDPHHIKTIADGLTISMLFAVYQIQLASWNE